MTDLIGIKKRAFTGHCTNENIRWLINEVEKLSMLIEEKEKTIVELGKRSKETADKYIDDLVLVNKQVKELSIKGRSDLNKLRKLLDEATEELLKAKKELDETKKELARMQRSLKERMNVDTKLH
jgi:hypothetical protein